MPLSLNGTTGIVAGNLANTGVTPASYTNANVTVNAQGQITAASNGTSAAYNVNHALFSSSGTWTCPAGVTRVKATVIAGGGGGGGNYSSGCSPQTGASGGSGGAATGYYTVVPGTGYSITVGTGGTNTNGADGFAGGAGGSSSFASFCSATGGGGGPANGGTPTSGVGTNGTLGNAIVTSGLSGFIAVGLHTGGGAAIVWSASINKIPGQGGVGRPSNGATPSTGGVGGAVLIEYVN